MLTMHYLRNSRLTIDEIAKHLDYNDLATLAEPSANGRGTRPDAIASKVTFLNWRQE